ncbi:hypothetical protein V6N13_145617 [Hibiscus sabdariffa]|uniref:Uncharacterized protein n=1 Tax=Hibiscus sabdariffa TaxID=183260 RepID=A0ABR2TQA3_9ROSI
MARTVGYRTGTSVLLEILPSLHVRTVPHLSFIHANAIVGHAPPPSPIPPGVSFQRRPIRQRTSSLRDLLQRFSSTSSPATVGPEIDNYQFITTYRPVNVEITTSNR